VLDISNYYDDATTIFRNVTSDLGP